MTWLVGGRIIGTERPVSITTHGGLITSLDAGRFDDPADQQIEITDLIVAPGLIDIQINGAYGFDFTSDPTSIWRAGARLPEQGVSAFLPTIITSPPEAIEAARDALAARPVDYHGAEPLGLHLEGPMLSPERPGVHDPGLLRLPTLDLIRGWTPAGGVAMVTMAPELAGSRAVIRALSREGVVVAAGHTAATLGEAEAGFEWGASAVTHLFNAMEPFDHRAPGLIGAVVRHKSAIAGMIVDGVHSDPAVVLAAWKWLGPSRLALVTDAIAATGLGDGEYRLGHAAVTVKHGKATDSSGRLAGSTLTMDRAIANLVEFAGCSPSEAVAAASTVPGGLLGRSDRGRLAVDQRADLVLFDDMMEVVATMVGGQFAYVRDGWAI
ncbi:MAG TPA: N-acetylglucosamine-6-phosphate deacetylase [Acidimicrobiia bacterium]|nr:N-acetylglucosamine-6-phosphate deacetylase [Acidimicrobiia bacterium]